MPHTLLSHEPGTNETTCLRFTVCLAGQVFGIRLMSALNLFSSSSSFSLLSLSLSKLFRLLLHLYGMFCLSLLACPVSKIDSNSLCLIISQLDVLKAKFAYALSVSPSSY